MKSRLARTMSTTSTKKRMATKATLVTTTTLLSTTSHLLVLLCLMKGSVIGQTDPSSRTDAADGSWWRTTPFASLPGMTTQQVLRSILPPDVIPYTPVSSPEETAGYVRDYVSTFKMQSRGMEHLHTYTNMFMGFIMPRHLVPPGNNCFLFHPKDLSSTSFNTTTTTP